MQTLASLKSSADLAAMANPGQAPARQRFASPSWASPPGQWVTDTLVRKPKQAFSANIKAVVWKRSFFQAVFLASMAAGMAALLRTGVLPLHAEVPDDKLYTVFSTLVSFFVVIRTGNALSRLFEAGSVAYSILGDWADAVSSLLSFTRTATADEESVHSFQNMLVILVSMLNALCLAELENGSERRAFDYNIINFVGFPTDVLADIANSDRKVETVFQLIQSMIVDNMNAGILNVPPPILTRSFQEMSQAMLKVHQAYKMVNVPYPVALNYASSFLLCIFSALTVWYLPSWVPHERLSLLCIFTLVFIYWFVHFVCGELERPFSASCTALDLAEVQDGLNVRLNAFVLAVRRPPLKLRAEFVAGTARPAEASLRAMADFARQHDPRKESEEFSSEQRRLSSVQETVHDSDLINMMSLFIKRLRGSEHSDPPSWDVKSAQKQGSSSERVGEGHPRSDSKQAAESSVEMWASGTPRTERSMSTMDKSPSDWPTRENEPQVDHDLERHVEDAETPLIQDSQPSVMSELQPPHGRSASL